MHGIYLPMLVLMTLILMPDHSGSAKFCVEFVRQQTKQQSLKVLFYVTLTLQTVINGLYGLTNFLSCFATTMNLPLSFSRRKKEVV